MHLFRIILGSIVFFYAGPRPGSGESSSQDEVEVTVVETIYNGQRVNYSAIGETHICGYSSTRASSGQVLARDYAWMALLATVNETHFQQDCGGSVLTRRHILTAAHCFAYDPLPNVVRLGEYDLSRTDDSQTFDYLIKDVLMHEDYDFPTHHNDIAIVVLQRTITYNPNVLPICLPPPKQEFTHEGVFVAGWGQTEYRGPPSPVLLETDLPVWNKTMCRDRLPCTIFDSNLCAGYIPGGKDACVFDSGGPLVKKREDGRWMVVAIVSYGYKCAAKKTPGIYTNVADYLDWIAPRIQLE